MTTFIRTSAGLINLDNIVCIKEVRQGKNAWESHIWYGEGEDVQFAKSSELNIEDTYGGVIVPASPGHFVVVVCDEPEYPHLLTPVIAWRILGGLTEPVCIDQIGKETIPAVLEPSGKVTQAGWERYESLDEYRRRRIVELKNAAALKAAYALDTKLAPPPIPLPPGLPGLPLVKAAP